MAGTLIGQPQLSTPPRLHRPGATESGRYCEIVDATKWLKSNRVAGEDDLPAEIYRRIADVTAPRTKQNFWCVGDGSHSDRLGNR